MPNAITLAQQFVPLLDEVYKLASLTSDLDGNPDLVRQGANANELIIPKLSMQGLGDYSRNSGYVDGDVTLTNETVAVCSPWTPFFCAGVIAMTFDAGTWWLALLLLGGLTGTAGYLIKRAVFGRVDKMEKTVEALREESIKKDSLAAVQEDIKQIRQDYTPRADHRKDLDECRADINRRCLLLRCTNG